MAPMTQASGRRLDEPTEPATETGAADFEASLTHQLAAEGSSVPMVITRGARHLIRYRNEAFRILSGEPVGGSAGLPLSEVMRSPALRELLDRVYQSGTCAVESGFWPASAVAGSASRSALVVPIFGRQFRTAALSVSFIEAPPWEAATTSADRIDRELRDANQALVMAAIREQKMAEDAVLRADELSAILENLGEGVIVIDLSRSRTLVTQFTRRVLGLDLAADPTTAVSTLRSLPFQRLDGSITTFGDLLDRSMQGEDLGNQEVVYSTPQGALLNLQLGGGTITDQYGRPAVSITLVRDLSELRRLEQTREEYVSLISHDIRGPLAATRVAAEMVINAPEQARELGEMIRQSTSRMDRMLRSLLDVYRLRAGQPLPLQLRDCDLGEIARAAISELISIHGNRFVLHADPEVQGHWSPDDLQRAVWNLVGNAVKYGSPETPITIRVSSTQGGARITVHNLGPTIPHDEQARLFAPFIQGRALGPGIPRGWGLGLTLVSGCARAHGGTIAVRSEPDEGTTFALDLPLDGAGQTP